MGTTPSPGSTHGLSGTKVRNVQVAALNDSRPLTDENSHRSIAAALPVPPEQATAIADYPSTAYGSLLAAIRILVSDANFACPRSTSTACDIEVRAELRRDGQRVVHGGALAVVRTRGHSLRHVRKWEPTSRPRPTARTGLPAKPLRLRVLSTRWEGVTRSQGGSSAYDPFQPDHDWSGKAYG